VVRTPEQKINWEKVLPPWPRAKIMVSQSCWDLNDLTRRVWVV